MGANRAWRNPEVRLERGDSAEREGPGALTQRLPRPPLPPHPHPQGGFEAGRGFDPGRLGAQLARPDALGEGRRSDPPRASPSPAPCTAPWARRLLPAVAGGTRVPPPTLQLFPSCPAPPQRQLGERLGGERGAAARLRAGTGEGSDMKELGPAGVAGSGNPRWSPPRPPRPRTSGPQELRPPPCPSTPSSVGWGRHTPNTQPFPERLLSGGGGRAPSGCESR